MDKRKIVEFLNKNDINDVEEIKYKDDIFVVRFYYDFDDDEIDAAVNYSNDECEAEEESETWYGEYYIPYLNDIAIDNVGDIIEDCMEELEVESQFVTYDADQEEDYSEVLAIFYDKNKNIEIDDVLDDLKL